MAPSPLPDSGRGAGTDAGGDRDAGLLADHGAVLLEVALKAVERAAGAGRPLAVKAKQYKPALRKARATFVTLTKSGELRGCVGTWSATQPLVEDVASNARAAALQDNRFAPVERNEIDDLDISISLLSPPKRVVVDSEQALLDLLRPGVDGLIVGEGRRRAVFLPEVWQALPGPREFVAQLKQKAGFAADYWSAAMRVETFTTCSIALSEQPPAN